MTGIAIDLAEVFGDGFSIELKNGGKAAFNYEEKSYKMKWTLDGTTFHAEGGGAGRNTFGWCYGSGGCSEQRGVHHAGTLNAARM